MSEASRLTRRIVHVLYITFRFSHLFAAMSLTLYDHSRQQAARMEYELNQELYFQRQSRLKRGPQSPATSQATTPQEATLFTGPGASGSTQVASEPSFAQPVLRTELEARKTGARRAKIGVGSGQVKD